MKVNDFVVTFANVTGSAFANALTTHGVVSVGSLIGNSDIIRTGNGMSKIAEAEQLALSLSKADRGKLASKLIESLGSPFDDDEDWVEEALRRDREMDEHPETAMSEEEFFSSLREYVRK